ncbi:MAG TPA: hypothetical protein VHV10_02060, partial [Ktedonobacteraceae bacterium]|nr:hypothetical protein [Ktedonobacteraceae bacterium]
KKKPPNNKKDKNVSLSPLSFPCSDIRNLRGQKLPNARIIKRDWLTGNLAFSPFWYLYSDHIGRIGRSRTPNVGHLMFTYAADPYALPQIKTLFGYMEIVSFLVITPSILLFGYQIMLGASTFRYAGALEGLARVALGGVAVGVSFALVQMMISLENCITTGIVVLHGQYPYPVAKVNGTSIPYMLPSQPLISYSGIVVPMTRWGCTVNSFMGIFSGPFMQDTLASVMPLFGHFRHLAGTVKTPHDLIQQFGQMIQMLLSILLWVQVFLRIIFLNYYILTAPLAFGCWALPGGAGQRVVRLWCKGFLTVLFIQAVQLFLLTTLPLLLPTLPVLPFDSTKIWQALLLEFPPILTLSLTLMVPEFLGTSMDRALGTAGALAGGVSVSIGTAASQMR